MFNNGIGGQRCDLKISWFIFCINSIQHHNATYCNKTLTNGLNDTYVY